MRTQSELMVRVPLEEKLINDEFYISEPIALDDTEYEWQLAKFCNELSLLNSLEPYYDINDVDVVELNTNGYRLCTCDEDDMDITEDDLIYLCYDPPIQGNRHVLLDDEDGTLIRKTPRNVFRVVRKHIYIT